MILPIYIEPQPVLHIPTTPVAVFDDALRELVSSMLESMHNADGIGLAAPQIGQSISLFVMEYSSNDAHPDDIIPTTAVINPEIIWRSPQKVVMEEACLSIPGVMGNVKRPRKITLRYTDEFGVKKEKTFSDLAARVAQHEFDHLRGVLFTDYVPEERRTYRKAPEYPRI